MQSSAASNNCFAALSTLKMPSGKFVLKSTGPAGDKETPAATGSNAIPIHGNKKSFGKKVGTGPTLKTKPNYGSFKPMPVNWAQSAHPGLLAPRPASKLSPQVKSFVRPSDRAVALKRAITSPLPCPSPSMDQFPALIPRQFLRSAEDKKMNTSSSSYSNVAQKGIKNGSKQSFRSEAFANASWNKTSMMSQDWFPLPSNEENISTLRNLWAFRATYPVDIPWKVINENDDMALGEAGRNGREATGKQVLRWLTSLDKYSIDKPESIEFINAYGSVDQLYKLQELTEIAKKRKQ